MSDQERTDGYVQAVLEQLVSEVKSLRGAIDLMNQKHDALAIARVSDRARMEILEDTVKRTACPKAGLCVDLDNRLRAVEAQNAITESDKKAAWSVWKVLVTVCGSIVAFAGFIWALIEIAKNFIHSK